MAQQKPERKVTIGQVLKLVDRLSPAERQELYRRLDLKSWGEDWRRLCANLDAQNKDLPPLTEQEIVAEMKIIRKEVQAERAQSGN
jgi:hypothetical protein